MQEIISSELLEKEIKTEFNTSPLKLKMDEYYVKNTNTIKTIL